MAIVGSSTDKYLEYAKNIRQEYISISDEDFKSGRRNFLKSLLKEENLFLTKLFNDKYMHQAKINIKEELRLYK